MVFRTNLGKELYFFNKPYLGDGSEGMCYRLNEIDAAKIFFSDSPYKYYAENLLKFSDIQIPSFSFAKEIIYLKKSLIGIIYPYKRGISLLERSIDKAPIIDLKIALEKLMVDIRLLSDKGIVVKDIAHRNTLYFYQEFSLIDTTFYHYSMEDSDEIFRKNCLEIIRLIVLDIIGRNTRRYISQKLNGNWYDDEGIMLNPVPFLEEMKEYLEHLIDEEVVDFYSAEASLKRVFKL